MCIRDSSEEIELHPTANFQFGFQRTVIFGGEGHEPVTLHTFLIGFFDTNDTSEAEKFSRTDPGARFSAFTFSYRLPFCLLYTSPATSSTSRATPRQGFMRAAISSAASTTTTSKTVSYTHLDVYKRQRRRTVANHRK